MVRISGSSWLKLNELFWLKLTQVAQAGSSWLKLAQADFRWLKLTQLRWLKLKAALSCLKLTYAELKKQYISHCIQV